MKPATFRARSGAWCLVSVALTGVLAAACGSASSSSAAGSGAGGRAKPPKISLDVTVTGADGVKAKHWTLHCDPAGGTRPDPAAACHVLQTVKSNPFTPLPKGIMCPMIVAGTKRATVTGTWYGKPVHMTIYDGGCYLERWAKVGQIFN
jgi:hypothetical protein